MIYITGDTHGLIDFLKLKNFFNKEYVSEKDYLIILGDAGIVWSQKETYINEYSFLGLTVFFIDGNHENFDLLNKFPVVYKNGAKCHMLDDQVYHVLRGEILLLNNLKFLCIGGATSIDKNRRIEGESWWKDENIKEEDINNALTNLEKYDYKVDYVLSHCAPSKCVMNMFSYNIDSNTNMLSKIDYYTTYKNWFFGHYHRDEEYKKFRCFYNDILIIESYDTKKDIKYYELYEGNDKYLRNCKTGRRTKYRSIDIPEWYYKNRAYGYSYYRLKDITDISFVGSYFDNHISKDSRFYLHYNGKLDKDDKDAPINDNEWDVSTWRCNVVNFINAVSKYSPHLNLDKIKAQINLVYDQYNGGSFYKINNRVYVRPFPNIITPVYKERTSNKSASYEVIEGKVILSQFVDLERAKSYAKIYVNGNLGIELFSIHKGSDKEDFIEAYDTGHNIDDWVYVRKISE